MRSVALRGAPQLPIGHCSISKTTGSSQQPRSLSRLCCPNTIRTPTGRFRLRSAHRLRCYCCSNSGGTQSSGEDDNKAILDAFFLGKAFAEALNERVGSTVGEVLSVIGQWQAEQQKQVLEFQDEVIERAKRAKEKSAMESMEVKGLAPKSSSISRDPTVPPDVSSTTTNLTKNDPLQDMLND